MDFLIDLIRQLAADNHIKWNGHATQRMIQRAISRKQVIATLMCGKIIEEYPEDYPYPSFLVFGLLSQGDPIHVVCSIGQENLWIITVYRPDNTKWHNNYMTRREV